MTQFKETSPEKKAVFNVKHSSPVDPSTTTLAADQEAPKSEPVTDPSLKGAQERVRKIPLGSGLLNKAAEGIKGRRQRQQKAIDALGR